MSWNTSIPTDTQLNWSSSLEELLSQSSSQDYELKTSHSVSLSNLTPDTIYYYVINAKAPTRGNIATGAWSFTTLPAEDTESLEPTDTQEQVIAQLKQQIRELQMQLVQLMRQLIALLLAKI